MRRRVVIATVMLSALVGAGIDRTLFPRAFVAAQAPGGPIRAQLFRFELQEGAEPTFETWMQYLHDHHAQVLETLDRERMYVEGIFRDREREPRVIYWLAVQGAAGAPVETSSHEVDRAHVNFMQRTLTPGSRRLLSVENWLLAPFIDRAITSHSARR